MSDPRGLFIISAGGKEYRLWLGMSVLADLQSRHGQDVFQRMEAPAGAGDDWLPDLNILVDLFLCALLRYHPDADRFVVDEIVAENAGAFPRLMSVAFPEAKARGKKARQAA
jgi:hypothetical protein